jgi:hypothetical protein
MMLWRGGAGYIRALVISLLGFVALNICYGAFFSLPPCSDCHAHVGVPFAYRDMGGYEGGGGFLWRGVFADSATILATAVVLALAVQHVLSRKRS